MHEMFLNVFPNLCALWQGKFKNLDLEQEPFRISDSIWSLIGKETVAANRTIPATMVRLLPDIFQDSGGFNAETWHFWMVWIAPYLLYNRMDPIYYRHHLLLVNFVKDCVAFTITPEILRGIHQNIIDWNTEYERLYYQYKPERLPLVPLTIHALVHTAQEIAMTGPKGILWEFVAERIMGQIARSVKSLHFPFSQLSNTVLQMERLKMMQYLYDFSDKEMCFSTPRNLEELSGNERMIQTLSETTVLRSPMQRDFMLPEDIRKTLAHYLRSQLPHRIPIKVILSALPSTVLCVGKIRVRGEKESICGTWAKKSTSKEKFRDSSFIRLEIPIPHRERGRIVHFPTCFYGQMHYIIRAVLPAKVEFGLEHDYEALLALVSFCDAKGDATRDLVWYSKLRSPEFVHVATIQCVVGRVKVGNRWGIIDTSVHCSRTSFFGSDDEDDD